MAYEIKPNSGSLFKNDRKQSDRHPDYTGTANVNGKEVRISAWVRESANGKKYFSLAFSDMDFQSTAPQQGAAPQRPATVAQPVQPGDDLPF